MYMVFCILLSIPIWGLYDIIYFCHRDSNSSEWGSLFFFFCGTIHMHWKILAVLMEEDSGSKALGRGQGRG